MKLDINLINFVLKNLEFIEMIFIGKSNFMQLKEFM